MSKYIDMLKKANQTLTANNERLTKENEELRERNNALRAMERENILLREKRCKRNFICERQEKIFSLFATLACLEGGYLK